MFRNALNDFSIAFRCEEAELGKYRRNVFKIFSSGVLFLMRENMCWKKWNPCRFLIEVLRYEEMVFRGLFSRVVMRFEER